MLRKPIPGGPGQCVPPGNPRRLLHSFGLITSCPNQHKRLFCKGIKSTNVSPYLFPGLSKSFLKKTKIATTTPVSKKLGWSFRCKSGFLGPGLWSLLQAVTGPLCPERPAPVTLRAVLCETWKEWAATLGQPSRWNPHCGDSPIQEACLVLLNVNEEEVATITIGLFCELWRRRKILKAVIWKWSLFLGCSSQGLKQTSESALKGNWWI